MIMTYLGAKIVTIFGAKFKYLKICTIIFGVKIQILLEKFQYYFLRENSNETFFVTNE
mgnify:CR=1 FL=1